MKKSITLIACLFLTIAINANYLNFFNNDGEVIGSIKTGITDADKLFKKTTSWASLLTESDLEKNAQNGTIELRGKMQTSSAFNPFAGNFTDFISYTVELSIKNGVINYKFINMTLIKKYEGFGRNEEKYLISELIDNIVNAEAKIKRVEASNKSKKDKKKAIKKIKADGENFGKALNKVKESINEKLNDLENSCL